MKDGKRNLAGALAILAGFASFLVFLPGALIWLLPLLLLFSLALAGKGRLPGIPVFLPFASGLLAWPMRLFYWDRGDFSLRTRNLLLLAFLFFLWLLARRRRWPQRFLRAFNAMSLRRRLLSVFLGAELLFIAAAALLTVRGVALVGDEPHYLAVSQSIARDGDLNIFNQHFRGGFREFLDVESLPAHGTWGRGHKRIYSYHLPGLSFTLTPFFFLRITPPLLHFLVRGYLGLFGAGLAVLAYLFALRLWRSRSLAFFVTLAFTLTTPVFFYSFHAFPEVQAMLLILGALYLLLFKNGGLRPLWAGLLLGASMFWGVKYALFIYPLTLAFCGAWLWRRRWRPALLLAAFPLLFQGLFFLYLHGAYGTLSPNAVYYGMLSPEQSAAFLETLLKGITPLMRLETLLDYFFDQRDGLLLYNPLYFLAFPGLLLALKNFRRYRVHLLLAAPAALFIANHAFSTIRAGYCPQGRYLAPAAWALMLFAVIYYREGRQRRLRGAFLALPAYSLFVSAAQALAPLTLYQPTTHDTLQRAGALFQGWSNQFVDLPKLLPSFIKTDNRGYLPNPAFLALFALLVLLALSRRPLLRRRPAPLAPWIAFFAAFALASLFPRLNGADPRLIPGPRGVPCRVYLDPPARAGEGGPDWLRLGRDCRVRLETLAPLQSIEVRLANRNARRPLSVSVSLFDEPAQRLELAAGGSGVLALDASRSRRVKARHGYQLSLRVRGGPPPSWQLGLAVR